MKFSGLGILSAVVAVCCVGFSTERANAAGPIAIQQTVSQAQTALTDASLGWRHRYVYRYRYGGWGYGGYAMGWRSPYYGYAGYGYARPWGYGGYGYGYPAYGYARYSYRGPAYYSGYSYASPYCASCAYSPMVYNVSSYGYPTQTYGYPSQPVIYTSPTTTYSAPIYSSPTYTPSYSTPVYSSPSYSVPTYVPSTTPTGYGTPAAAPYPAPPVEYTAPAVYQPPFSNSPVASNEVESIVPARSTLVKMAFPQSQSSLAGINQPVIRTTAYQPHSAANYLAARFTYQGR